MLARLHIDTSKREASVRKGTRDSAGSIAKQHRLQPGAICRHGAALAGGCGWRIPPEISSTIADLGPSVRDADDRTN